MAVKNQIVNLLLCVDSCLAVAIKLIWEELAVAAGVSLSLSLDLATK